MSNVLNNQALTDCFKYSRLLWDEYYECRIILFVAC